MKKLFLFLFLGMVVLLSSCKKDETPSNTNDSYYNDAAIGGVQYKETVPYDNSNTDLVAGSPLGFEDIVFSGDILNYGIPF